MKISKLSGSIDFVEVDMLNDLESEIPFKNAIMPTVLLLSAIIRHARNDLNTRAYHRSGCSYYRGIMFEYHVELLQTCFAVSGLPSSKITAANARKEAEDTLGLDPGYLSPQYADKFKNAGAAANAAIELYRTAARNKNIAQTVLNQHMPELLDDEAFKKPTDKEIEALEQYFERKKQQIESLGHNQIAVGASPIMQEIRDDLLGREILDSTDTPNKKDPAMLAIDWLAAYSTDNQLELWAR